MILRLVGNRLGQALLAALGASVLVWSLLPLAPGDPALRTLQARGITEPEPAQVDAVREELGLDRSLPAQYVTWLSRAVRGDLSESYRTNRPVFDEIVRRIPASAMLAVTAIALAILLAVPAGVAAAAWPGRWPDTLLRGGSLVIAAAPGFLIGLLLLQSIVLQRGWGQAVSDGRLSQVWLPATALAVGAAADWSRLLRANLLEQLGSEWATVAMARGATQARVLVRHALPNAVLPLLTAIGMSIGALLGGAAIIEAVFTWPGVGTWLVMGVAARDLPVVQGFAVLAALVYVATSFGVDVLGRLIDPRTRRVTA